MTSERLHLVWLRSGAFLVSRKPYADWREIQDEFADYMTSLGPFTADEAADWLAHEYPRARNPTADELRAFAASDAWTLTL